MKALSFFTLFGIGIIGLTILGIALWAANGKLGIILGGILGVICMWFECFYLYDLSRKATSDASVEWFRRALFGTVVTCALSLLIFVLMAITKHNTKKISD